MRLSTLAAVALALVPLAGCGGSEPRDRVDAYIVRVNELQRGFETEFKVANETYQAFARSAMTADAAVARLRTAALSIVAARDGLTDLEPPAEAQGLHSRLVRLYDMNEDFANETLRLARYQRDSERLLRPLDRADARLRRELAGAREATAQARALHRFALVVGTAAQGLREVAVPRVLNPGHWEQVRRLERTRDLAGRLERALRAQDARRVASLVREFRRRPSSSRARRRLAREAIREYERRYRQLSAAYGELRQAHADLGRTLD